jgi:replicative DNA helicase
MNVDYVEATASALIGQLIWDNKHYAEAAKSLRAEDFPTDMMGKLFTCVCGMIASGRGADYLTVCGELSKHGLLSACGGAANIARLTESPMRKPNIAEYVTIVKEGAQRRRAQGAIEALAKRIEDPSENVDAVLASGVSRMLELQSSKDDAASASVIVPLLDQMAKEHARTGELLGLPTGFARLDYLTRGLPAGEPTVVAARTGNGKTAFMLQAAIANCKAGNPVMIFSLEMTRDSIYRRIFASVSGVPFARVRDTKWATEDDLAKIRYAAGKVAEWPLEIDPSGSIHIDQITAAARHAVRRKGVKLVCVDYAQIVPADGRDERLRVAAVSRGLTRLAKDEGIPVLLLSQLARPDRSNVNRRPRLSDLRETSQLENDAGVAVLLHRAVDEEEEAGPDAEVIIAKHRNGATAIIEATFNQASLTFEPRHVASAQAARRA